MERLQVIQSKFDDAQLWVVRAIFVFYRDPEETGDIIDLFWVMKQELLVKIWILAIFDHNRHHFVGVCRL